MHFEYNIYMLRYCIIFITALFFTLPLFVNAASTVWESLELGFYSRIHENIDSTVDTLRKKELSKFPTFAGFGSCRGPIAWLDIEPMDEQLLRDISEGYFGSLSDLMNKNKILIPSNSDAYTNLAICLAQTYRELGESAAKDETALSSMWLLWLYSDGDTSNSDYDIVSDIEKINAVLFTEKLDYIGKVNISKQSFSDMAAWVPIAPITGWSIGWGWDTVWSQDNGTNTSPPPSATAVWIGDVCSVDTSPSAVDNIIDDAFLSELGAVMAGGTPPLGGASYAGELPVSTLEIGADWDFFHTPPCTDNFCIKVQLIPWKYGLMWWSSFSIESLLDKHIGIMEPIANSNLAAQEFSMNSYEQAFKNLKLKNLISTLIYIDTRPQQEKTYKKEYTQDEMNKEFDEMQRCAYVSAWLSSDMRRANILGWAWYQKDILTDADTLSDKVKSLSVLDPEDTILATSCMSIGLWQARMEYYQSFSTDLTELEAFTSSLVSLISAGTDEHKALDKKKIK